MFVKLKLEECHSHKQPLVFCKLKLIFQHDGHVFGDSSRFNLLNHFVSSFRSFQLAATIVLIHIYP